MSKFPVRNLLFDLGNVLIDIDIPGAHTRIRQLFREDASKEVIDQALLKYECGKISTEIFINALLSQSQRHVQALDIIEAWNSMLIGMPASRIDMLYQLKPHFPLYVLSNTNALHIEWVHRYMKREHGLHRFEDLFTTTYYSHLVRDRKPNASIFEFITADAGIVPEQTLFLDDLPENIETAESIGFQTCLVRPGEEVSEILGQRLMMQMEK